jgi:hypothetical protein
MASGARARSTRRTRVVILGGAVCSVALLALAPPARAREATVVVEDVHGICRVRGEFKTPVSDSLAWAVLTDYDHIHLFVRSVRSSESKRGDDGRILLRQEAVGGVLFFHRHLSVTLEIEETPRRIAFHDVLGKDFRSYVGEWRIVPDSSGTHVEYEVEADPRTRIPKALFRGIFRRSAEDLLDQVRTEMLRRAKGAGGRSGGLLQTRRAPQELRTLATLERKGRTR